MLRSRQMALSVENEFSVSSNWGSCRRGNRDPIHRGKAASSPGRWSGRKAGKPVGQAGATVSPPGDTVSPSPAESGLAQSQEEGNADSQPTSNFLKVGGRAMPTLSTENTLSHTSTRKCAKGHVRTAVGSFCQPGIRHNHLRQPQAASSSGSSRVSGCHVKHFPVSPTPSATHSHSMAGSLQPSCPEGVGGDTYEDRNGRGGRCLGAEVTTEKLS